VSPGARGTSRHPRRVVAPGAAVLVLAIAAACGSAATSTGSPGGSPVASTSLKPSVVVTYTVLGSVVKDLVGDAAIVTVLMPNGADPHEWQPSARDIEAVNRASLVVENGLGLEAGLQNALAEAERNGVRVFVASDYITVRHVGQGEGTSTGDPNQQPGAGDPHLWMDPLAMKAVVGALSDALRADLGLDVGARAADLGARLDALDREVAATLASIPPDHRKLVTGHESMGYFAARYGFALIGAVIPGLTSQEAPAAADLAALKAKIQAAHVPAIFTEIGTPAAVAQAIGTEAGVKVVEIATHNLPVDGSYFTFMKDVAKAIADALV
jgi:zinc/manganese transport system substrate-binding protein